MGDPATHSRFGGSIADRYMNCVGSVALCGRAPEKPDSPYAAEGTAAHLVAEQALKDNLPASNFEGMAYTKPGSATVEVTAEMCQAVQVYLDEVERESSLSKTSELYVEKDFVLDIETAEDGEVFGTNDAMVYHPETGRLRVFDYKHGVGVSVSADDNAQLKFYAAGAVFSHPDWRINEVVLTIVQPRARTNEEEGDAIRDWTFTVTDLLDFTVEIEEAVGRAKAAVERLRGKASDTILDTLAVGDWCKWCDAAAFCPLREKVAREATTLDFADIALVDVTDLPDPRDLDVERLAQIVKGLHLVSKWMGQCQEHLESLVLNGTEVPGWKAVEKIGRVKWIEDPLKVSATAQLEYGLDEDQIMPRKLVTIGEAEKLLKAAGATKEDVDTFKLAFTIKESSGLTVAQISNRRPAVATGAAEFSGVNL